jgi:hypothetical protein
MNLEEMKARFNEITTTLFRVEDEIRKLLEEEGYESVESGMMLPSSPEDLLNDVWRDQGWRDKDSNKVYQFSFSQNGNIRGEMPPGRIKRELFRVIQHGGE